MEEKEQKLRDQLILKARSVFKRNRSFDEVKAEMDTSPAQSVKPGPLNQGGRHPVEQG